MLLIKVINDYLYFVKVNRTFGTWDSENDAANRFIRFFELKNITLTKEIKKDLLIDFVAWCKSKNNCNKTINKSIAVLRRSFKYSNIENKDLFNYPNLIEEKKHFEYLSDYKINKLLNYLDSLKNNELNVRNKLIILLLLDTGVRISELLDIQLKNINVKYNCILLKHTKKHRERIVFFTDKTKELLKKYVKFYCEKENIYLFYNKKEHTKMVYSTVITMFNKVKASCNFKKFSPHMLRHTNATILAYGGMNEFDLMNLLGHASATTTQVYVHNNSKLLAKKYKQAFLKGNKDNNYNK